MWFEPFERAYERGEITYEQMWAIWRTKYT